MLNRVSACGTLNRRPIRQPSISGQYAVDAGDEQAAEKLLALVYEELRRLAAIKMANEAPGHTLQPTALVHEAWLRISGPNERHWDGRQHFFATAAEAMRRILVDRARRRQAFKHGAGAGRLSVDELDIPPPAPDDQLLVVDESLAKLAEIDSRKAELVKLRYFVGLSFEETAEVLGIAVPTAKKWWAYARAWLRVEIAGSALGGSTEKEILSEVAHAVLCAPPLSGRSYLLEHLRCKFAELGRLSVMVSGSDISKDFKLEALLAKRLDFASPKQIRDLQQRVGLVMLVDDIDKCAQETRDRLLSVDPKSVRVVATARGIPESANSISPPSFIRLLL